MRALTVLAGRASTLALTGDIPEPERAPGQLLVESLLVGICGTDREIVSGIHGKPPPGKERLILGHESLGRVLECDADSGFRPGELVVGIVRRPCPVPCSCCAVGAWDMCNTGLYTERGIEGADGYASERFTLEHDFAILVPELLGELAVLLEPASVVAKAWEQIERIAGRSEGLELRNVLVAGAGPIGLLAALFGVQRGYQVTVLDRVEEGVKPDLVRALGASYHTGAIADLASADIVVECTGSGQVVVDVLANTARNSITCLTGLSSGVRKVALYASQLNDTMVLENDVVFGSVNANRRHYEQALAALMSADLGWLAKLTSRRVALSDFQRAFEPQPDDVKVVLDMRT